MQKIQIVPQKCRRAQCQGADIVELAHRYGRKRNENEGKRMTMNEDEKSACAHSCAAPFGFRGLDKKVKFYHFLLRIVAVYIQQIVNEKSWHFELQTSAICSADVLPRNCAADVSSFFGGAQMTAQLTE